MPETISLDELRVESPETATAMPGQTAPSAPAQAEYGQASDANVQAGSATGYNAQTGEIDPATMTSAGRMTEITGRDSPLMRRAGKQGMLEAARRGLQNSSFAAGAATGAMVDRATPLAQQDAQTYFSNMRANVDAANRAAEVSTGRETDVSLQNAREVNAMAALDAKLGTEVNLANLDADTRRSLLQAELDQQANLENTRAENAFNLEVLRSDSEINRQYLAGTQAVDLASVQGRYQQLISSNQAAAMMYQSYMGSIGQAMANDKVTPDRIASYINVMAQQMEGSLELIDAINTLDLGDINVPGATASGAGATSTVAPTDQPAGTTAPAPYTPNYQLNGFNLVDLNATEGMPFYGGGA